MPVLFTAIFDMLSAAGRVCRAAPRGRPERLHVHVARYFNTKSALGVTLSPGGRRSCVRLGAHDGPSLPGPREERGARPCPAGGYPMGMMPHVLVLDQVQSIALIAEQTAAYET